MKRGLVWIWSLELVGAALLLAGGSPQAASGQAMDTAGEPQIDGIGLAGAAVKPISTEKPLPPNINLAGPVAEVIRLAESGVQESVIMAFVTNSTSPFNLGVEEIIYLNDIGIPGSIVNAMMQRDQALKGLPANTGPMLAAPSSVAPANPSAPAPGTPASYAPQPAEPPAAPEMVPEAPPSGDYAAEGYPPPPATDTGYSTFYDSLTPYGTWVDVAGYGHCWQPTVGVANPID